MSRKKTQRVTILIFKFQIFMNMRLISEEAMTHRKLLLKCFKISPSIVIINHTGLNSNFNFETGNENEVCKTFSSFIC